jgi:hypothetical protein
MTIAKIAFLTTPSPDRFILNIQAFGCDDVQQFEISKHHLSNILIDGCALVLRETSTFHTHTERGDHERSTAGA